MRDTIISILTSEWPLTAKKIYNKVRQNGHNVSYQAVYKTLQEMTADGKLIRQNKEYKISLSWIEKIDQLTSNIKNVYKGSAVAVDILLKDRTNLTFSTVMGLYRFILDLCSLGAIKNSIASSVSLAYMKHAWYAFVGSEREQEQFRQFMSFTQGSIFVGGNSAIDKLLATYYMEIGKNVKVYTNTDIKLNFDRVVIADFIIDVYFPKEITYIFDWSYTSSNVLSDAKLKKLYDTILYKETEIHVIVNRNKKIADRIRDNALRYFGEKNGTNSKHTTN